MRSLMVAEVEVGGQTGFHLTDHAPFIDAMGLLHSKSVGGSCIVSSDSGYALLATGIREGELIALGVVRPITPKAFVNACEVPFCTENISPQENMDSHMEEIVPTSRRSY